MRSRLTTLIVASALLTAALHLPVNQPRALAQRKPLLVVITARASMNSISLSSLRRAFTGMPTEFEGGKRFVPLNPPTGTPLRIQFDRAVLGLEPEAVGAFWIDRRIRDESPPPRIVPTLDLALRVVAKLPGAITYAPAPLTAAGVKALKIDNLSAGQPGYPLN